MAQTLLPFPTNMLGGFVKKAALYLPLEHRNPIMVAAQSKTKPNLLLEKTKIIIVCILAAKQHNDMDAFKIDIRDAIATIELNTSEFALFDGFLGAKQGMLLEMAKRGVSRERLDLIRAELPARIRTQTALASTPQLPVSVTEKI